MAAEHVLKNTVATLDLVFSAGAADAAVVVNITKADGSVLVTNGATTHVGATGEYTYALAPQAELDYLTVVWSGTWGGVAQSITTYVEIIGGQLYSLAELRGFGDKALGNAATYPDAALRSMRAECVDLFWDVTRMAFVPRFYRESIDGTNANMLFLTRKRPTRIISCSVGGVALSSPEIAAIKLYPTGRLYRPVGWPFDRQNVIVSYEYGWQSVPRDVARAALILSRYELVSNDLSDRMVSFSSDLGTFRLSVPGVQYPTGIPLVDATLTRYDETDAMGP